DTDRANGIASASGAAYVPTRSIREAFALVESADFVFTPDTSIAHAVSAFRKPSVAIYAKGKRSDWDLFDTPGVSVEHTEPSMQGLPLARVLEAVDSVWDLLSVSRG